MRKIVSSAFFVILLMVMLSSCNKKESGVDLSPLYGTWRSISYSTDGGKSTTNTYYIRFYENSTLIEVDATAGGSGDAIGSVGDSDAATSQEKYTVSRGTWVYVGGEFVLQGGGVVTSTSTRMILFDNSLTIFTINGSHIFTRVADSTIAKYLKN